MRRLPRNGLPLGECERSRSRPHPDLLALRWFGLYRPRRDRSVIGELSDLVKCSVAGVLVVVTLAVVFDTHAICESLRRRIPFSGFSIANVVASTKRPAESST